MIEYRPDENGKTSMMRQKWNVQTMINSWIDGWFEGQFLNICKNNAKDGINGNFFIQLFLFEVKCLTLGTFDLLV